MVVAARGGTSVHRPTRVLMLCATPRFTGLLGRDSCCPMRLEQRTYTTLPRQPSQPTFGELYLTTQGVKGKYAK